MSNCSCGESYDDLAALAQHALAAQAEPSPTAERTDERE